jgi:NAD(P)H-dependent FMN reductase
MNSKVKIALILGSIREGRRCDAIAQWASEEIQRHPAFELDIVDPLKLMLPSRHEKEGSIDLRELARRIDEADAFIVIVPEYNHGYPAALKHLIDSIKEPWRGKPVGFVSYGGMSGGIRAVEQLRQVFAELHATTVRDQVALVDVWEKFDARGQLRSSEPMSLAMGLMLLRMDWWAKALREGRRVAPYDGARA